MKNTRGSEWNKWDLHIHTASSYDSPYKADIVDYYKYVFKEIDEKPIILCSDCHDPRKYSAKESLWIKANVTFEGLKQCIFQPSEVLQIWLN